MDEQKVDICRIFYSWQSDIKHSKNFISDCLKKIPNRLKNISVVEIDRDTEGVAGAPDIGNTIYEKIDCCDIFVADVTIINQDYPGRKTPNPNVLIELGYAIRALGWERIILLYDGDCGDVEDLPFDINHQRMTKYSLREEDKVAIRTRIVSNFSATIEILKKKKMLHGGNPSLLSARKELGTTIEKGMRYVFVYYEERYVHCKDDFGTDFIVITDEHFRKLDMIRDVLSDESYFKLAALLQKLKLAGIGTDDAYGWEYAEEIAIQYFEPLYREYGGKMAALSFEQVLCKEFTDLYNELVGYVAIEYSFERIEDCKLIFKDDGDFQEAYDSEGNLLCKGKLTEEKFSGYKVTEMYTGEFRNAMRHGAGDELTNHFNYYGIPYGSIRRSGKWNQNRFVEGIIYNAVLFLNDSKEFELLETEQADDLITGDTREFDFLVGSADWREKSENYYLANVTYSGGVFNIIKETLKPLQEFSKY